jgi:hypothetical protein
MWGEVDLQNAACRWHGGTDSPDTRRRSQPESFVCGQKRKQDFHTVRSSLVLNGTQANIETLFLDPRNVDLSDAVVLTDDKPILELLNIAAGNAWRKGYTEMTKTFYQEGVPLFR